MKVETSVATECSVVFTLIICVNWLSRWGGGLPLSLLPGGGVVQVDT